MFNELMWGMINNGALLLALVVAYELSVFVAPAGTRNKEAWRGLFISVIGIAIMLVPFQLLPGLVFDTRTILLSVTGFFFGTVTTVIPMVILAAYRASQGGVGVYTGVATILTSGAIGLLWTRLRPSARTTTRRGLELLAMGVIVHLVMLLCMFLMPLDIALNTVRQIGPPVLLIYPVGTVVLGLLLFSQQDRRRAQQDLAESEARYRSMFANNHAIMLLIDPDTGTVIDANPAACAHYGWSLDEFRAKSMLQINTLAHEAVLAEMRIAAEQKRNYFIFRHRKADGTEFDAEVHSGPVQLGGKALLYSIVNDISWRTEAEKALRASEERFRMLIEAAPFGISVQTAGLFRFVNATLLSTFGASDETQLLNTPVLDRIHPDYHHQYMRRVRQLNETRQPLEPIEYVQLRLDGSPFNASVSAAALDYYGELSLLVFIRDITDQKQAEAERQHMEEQLRQQQKLEAIGTLAGGVAHEINNPITGIINYAQLIIDDPGDQGSRAYAGEIIHESQRIAEIVRHLLQFSRQERQSHSPAHIEDILNDTLSLVRNLIRRDSIAIDVEIAPDLPAFRCRSQQIQQVVMNLLINARDALNEKYPEAHPDKRVMIKVWLDQRHAGRWLMLQVEDWGVGISPEVQERIFEPFFTTKPADRGTGLGLAISYGIVRDHHGLLACYSEPGDYTRFVMELPVDNGWEL